MENKDYFELVDIDINKLHKLQKDNFKIISRAKKIKLRRMILQEGIKSPFFIWKNNNKYYIIDGHQRYDVIKELIDEGKIKNNTVPAVIIKAKNKDEAMKTLLILNTKYSEINKNGLLEIMETINLTKDFMENINIEINDIYKKDIDLTKVDEKINTTNYLFIEYNVENIEAISKIIAILNDNNIYYEQMK